MSENKITIGVNPEDSKKLDEIIRESYDVFIRLERRNLLIISSLMIFTSIHKFTFEKVNVLGVFVNNVSFNDFSIVLFFTCLYFIFAFSVYAYPSYNSSQEKWSRIKNERMKIISNKHRWSLEIKNHFLGFRYFMWMFIHYIFPLIFGFIALVLCAIQIYELNTTLTCASSATSTQLIMG